MHNIIHYITWHSTFLIHFLWNQLTPTRFSESAEASKDGCCGFSQVEESISAGNKHETSNNYCIGRENRFPEPKCLLSFYHNFTFPIFCCCEESDRIFVFIYRRSEPPNDVTSTIWKTSYRMRMTQKKCNKLYVLFTIVLLYMQFSAINRIFCGYEWSRRENNSVIIGLSMGH